MAGWIVTRKDGSTAWIENEQDARAYAADVQGSVRESEPVIVELTGPTQPPEIADPGAVPHV